MGTHARLRGDGVCHWIRFNALSWRLRVSLWRRGATFGSSLGSALGQNSSGYLVRADQPHQTTSAPTVAAPRPE